MDGAVNGTMKSRTFTRPKKTRPKTAKLAGENEVVLRTGAIAEGADGNGEHPGCNELGTDSKADGLNHNGDGGGFNVDVIGCDADDIGCDADDIGCNADDAGDSGASEGGAGEERASFPALPARVDSSTFTRPVRNRNKVKPLNFGLRCVHFETNH